jgi:ADP-ribose pyrophosphatase YjhB (NUDIX family)
MEINYCRRCGTKTVATPGGASVCVNGHSSYPNAAPCVGLFLFDSDGKLLLGVRAEEPNKGKLDCFGGFVDGPETIEATLAREVTEELGLQPTDYTTPIYLTSAASTYDFQGEARSVLSSLFYAYLLPGTAPRANDDVASIYRAFVQDVAVDDIGNDDIKQGFIALKARLDGTS